MTSENCRIIKYLQVYVTGNKKSYSGKVFCFGRTQRKKMYG